MNTKTITLLAEWLEGLIREAELDTNLSFSQFTAAGDDDVPFVLAGGWSEGYSESCNDILYMSKTHPTYAMCVKIAVKASSSTYVNFDSLEMPTYKHGEVDDTCIPLERGEDPKEAAKFFLMEFERVCKEYEADLYQLD
jgi:hypothetical protein